MKARITHREYLDDPEEVRRIAEQFASELHKEMGHLIRAVALFGSFVRHKFSSGKKPLIPSRDEVLFSSDIDILIVFDDLIHVMSPEVITAYRVVTEKVASKISKRLHITTIPLTKFWDYCYKGDPIMINMLRDGEPIHDSGIFKMAKQMLHDKSITPTREIIWTYLGNGPLSLQTAKWNLRQAILDLYWSVTDAAHAALLRRNVVPDTPEQVVTLFNHHIVKMHLTDKKYLITLAEFHNIGKMIIKGELKTITGNHYDKYKKDAEEFIKAAKEIIQIT